MDYQLLMEIATGLSILAVVIGFLASCGVFKSRRQREVEAKLKMALRRHAQSQSISARVR